MLCALLCACDEDDGSTTRRDLKLPLEHITQDDKSEPKDNEAVLTLDAPLTDAQTEKVTAAVQTTAIAETEKNTSAATAPATKRNGGTYTGLPALAQISFSVSDPNNARGLSTEKKLHSYGVPKNGKPNFISVDNQKYFDSCGYKAIAYDNKTDEKVLYLTFDCGYENGCTGKILDTLKTKRVPAAFFCTYYHIKGDPELVARMINEGHIVGNHSKNHPDFSTISRTRMASELTECENYLRENFGYSSKFFRFPQGVYTESALDVVDSMGLTSVFWSSAYADWDINNLKGGQYAYNVMTARIHPGAVILLHAVSKDNADALGDIIDYARKSGYRFESLDN